MGRVLPPEWVLRKPRTPEEAERQIAWLEENLRRQTLRNLLVSGLAGVLIALLLALVLVTL